MLPVPCNTESGCKTNEFFSFIYLTVSMEFFDDITIPYEYLQQPSKLYPLNVIAASYMGGDRASYFLFFYLNNMAGTTYKRLRGMMVHMLLVFLTINYMRHLTNGITLYFRWLYLYM